MGRYSRLAGLITCTLVVGMVGVLVVTSNLLAGEPPDLSRYLLTKPQALFSLQYGQGSSQVGMFIAGPEEGLPSGPSDFAIGIDGSIYIGDEQNGKVKKFNRKGQLLMVTDGHIDRIAGMGVDSHGRIYVIHGTASNEIAVYDEKGKRLPDVERKITEAVEKLADNLASTKPQLERDIFRGWRRPPIGAVRCDASGNLYFQSGQFILKVDAQFAEAQVHKERPLDARGRRYAYRFLAPEREVERLVYGIDGSLVNRFLTPILQRVEVTIYDVDGSEIRRFTLPRGNWSEVERLVPVGGGDIDCDGRGHFYTVRSPVAIYHRPLKPGIPNFFVKCCYAVLEYDAEGNFVGVRALFNGFTMPSRHWVEVDAQGNVYWLDFEADHLKVMMAPVPK